MQGKATSRAAAIGRVTAELDLMATQAGRNSRVRSVEVASRRVNLHRRAPSVVGSTQETVRGLGSGPKPGRAIMTVDLAAGMVPFFSIR